MARPRGRPLKFGRPSRLVALTLPDNVLEWLKKVHPDPAWAIVSLFEQASGERSEPHSPEIKPVDIALVAGRRGLIVVDRQAFRSLPGVALLPLSESHAFLALEPGRGIRDLELAVLDRLDDTTSEEEREALGILRQHLRAWRQDPSWRFEPRAIIVAERVEEAGAAPVRARAQDRS